MKEFLKILGIVILILGVIFFVLIVLTNSCNAQVTKSQINFTTLPIAVQNDWRSRTLKDTAQRVYRISDANGVIAYRLVCKKNDSIIVYRYDRVVIKSTTYIGFVDKNSYSFKHL